MAKNTVQGGNPVEPIHGFEGAVSGEVIQSSVLVKEGTDTPLPSDVTAGVGGKGLRVDQGGTQITTGRSTANIGSGTQLNGAASLSCKSVWVEALPTNNQVITVGDSAVDASNAGRRGASLYPEDGVEIAIDNVNKIYFDVLFNGDGCNWTATT